jgi:hypothetical protein
MSLSGNISDLGLLLNRVRIARRLHGALLRTDLAGAKADYGPGPLSLMTQMHRTWLAACIDVFDVRSTPFFPPAADVTDITFFDLRRAT